MKSEERVIETKITNIVEAEMYKRVFAAAVDFIFASFLWMFLAMLVMTPIANSTLQYSEKMTIGYHYQVASHLYVYEQYEVDGTSKIIEVKNYTTEINNSLNSNFLALSSADNLEPSYYLEHLRYYYLSFLTGENIELPISEDKTYDMVDDYFVAPDYLEQIDGISKKDYYTHAWFNENILKINSDGSTLFFIDENGVAFVKEGVDVDSARTYLKSLIYDASKDLYYQPFYQDLNKELKLIQGFVIILPPYLISMVLLYLVIPLCFKNGETLSKKFFHLALVNKDGYSIKKRQTVFRFLVFFVEITLSLFILGVGYTSLATCGVGIAILFFCTLLNKKHRAPHDLAAYTMLIDASKSVWFDSPLDEEKRKRELEEKMDKYKSTKIENKNVIQIGSTIVDEKTKIEYLEENRKENN